MCFHGEENGASSGVHVCLGVLGKYLCVLRGACEFFKGFVVNSSGSARV